ncbi:MAG TPA: GH116 family glycosyl-hydrolase [Capsulimonadaceae bacterium]|jgi:uncharacterized protein (DUF608 family)
MSIQSVSSWPILRHYEAPFLDRIALPLGGIGTGTISLGGRGDLRDWEVMNRPAKGFAPERAFFAIRIKEGDTGKTHARALEGPLPFNSYYGGFGMIAANHGLPRFESSTFDAAYPFGQVHLTDSEMPVTVRLEAFNPFVPVDSDAGSYPAAVLRYVVTNTSASPLDVSVCGTVRNFIGRDGKLGKEAGNVNSFRTGARVRGIEMTSGGVAKSSEQYGTVALVTPDTDTVVSHRTDWEDVSWGMSNWGMALLDFWDDLTADGDLTDIAPSGVANPTASLCSRVAIAPGESRALTFIIAWHFPNRMTWTPAKTEGGGCGCADGECEGNGDNIGNYYTHRFTDAWHAAEELTANLPDLEARTVEFVETFIASDLPAVVKEAALFNVSTLRSQTVFQTPDGRLYGWEGCGDHDGCCPGSCTHVWNYETALGSLFGGLSRSMRDVEMSYMSLPSGMMPFRVTLPLVREQDYGVAAADGQMGAIARVYRDWKLSGDETFLRTVWPGTKRSLEFCWVPGGWDADQDGVMEGCQHNTMDVEYYGPNGQMSFWYLCALRASEEMARHLGDADFAAKCRKLFESGSKWVDANLFNGEYYEHKIVPPRKRAAIAPGLLHTSSIVDLDDPQLQLGEACLVDQLVGQYMAIVCGLGQLGDPAHMKTTLESIYRYNYMPSFRSHFNHMRTFVLGDEAATLMATYPRGNRPKRPFPYFSEVMTGFEYTAAVGMLQFGMEEEGLTLIRAIRDRYEGQKRNPFDEAECGHHYARAMASWSALLTLTGFDYDATTATITFARAKSQTQWFWSSGNAWGTVAQTPEASGTAITLRILGGETPISTVALTGDGGATVADVTWDTVDGAKVGRAVVG